MNLKHRTQLIIVTTLVLAVLVLPKDSLAQLVVGETTKEKVIALTFDDGPDPQTTVKIASELKSLNVPATFFEVGKNIKKYPSITRTLSQKGFAIENHSWSHPFKFSSLTLEQQLAEMAATNTQIAAVTGVSPTFFRPPHGSCTKEMVNQAMSLRLTTTLWGVDPGDWQTNNAQLIASRVVRSAYPGAIVVLHDHIQDGPTAVHFQNRSGTILALPVIVKQLRAKGYRFVSLDELLAAGTPNNNSRCLMPRLPRPIKPAVSM